MTKQAYIPNERGFVYITYTVLVEHKKTKERYQKNVETYFHLKSQKEDVALESIPQRLRSFEKLILVLSK